MTARTPGQVAFETHLNAHWDDEARVWEEIARAAFNAHLPKVLGHPQDAAEEYLAETFEPDDSPTGVGYEREHMIDAFAAGWQRAQELIATYGRDETGRWHTLEPAAAASSAQQIADLRGLAAEILDEFAPTGAGHAARVGQVQIRKWRERAGLT